MKFRDDLRRFECILRYFSVCFLKKLPYGVITRRQFGGRRGGSGNEKINIFENFRLGSGVVQKCF